MKKEATGEYYNIGVVAVKRNEFNYRRTASAEGKRKPKLSDGSGDPSMLTSLGKRHIRGTAEWGNRYIS